MALFNRKPKDNVLPEVEQYYQAERRDRTGLAWLLALVSMVIVAGILVGIFLAGRWAYNKIANNDDTQDIATTETADAPSFDGTPSNNEGEADNDSTDNQADQGDDAETERQSEDTDRTPAPATTPQTSSTSTNLPNTGPGDVVAIFTGVSAAAGGAHYALQRRKQNR